MRSPNQQQTTIWDRIQQQDTISHIKQLYKLGSSYPQQNIANQIKNLSNEYKYYKSIKGDGNCFYRAVAFFYLRQNKLDSFSTVFKDIKMICKNCPIAIDNQQDFKTILKEAFNKFLKPLSSITNKAQKQCLIQNLFNRYWAFDTIMIVYFRSLNYHQIISNVYKYKSYYQDKNHQLNKIATFYQQSQGVQLNSLADVLNMKIQIVFINATQNNIFVYNQKGRDYDLKLFFRPGHYDIIYYDRQVQSLLNYEKSKEKSKFNIWSLFQKQKQKQKISQEDNSENRRNWGLNSQISSKINLNKNSNNRNLQKEKNSSLSSQSSFLNNIPQWRKSSDPRVSRPNNYVKQSGILKMNNSSKRNQNSYNSKITNSQQDYHYQVKKDCQKAKGATSQENIKQFNKCYSYVSDKGLSFNSNIKKISVKDKIERVELDFWRFLVEFVAILVFLGIVYKIYFAIVE